MTYSTPPTKNPNDQILSADWNTFVRDNFEDHEPRLQGLEDPPGGTYSRTANLTLNVASTYTKIPLDTVLKDPFALFNAGTGEIDVGVSGRWLVTGNMDFNNTGLADGDAIMIRISSGGSNFGEHRYVHNSASTVGSIRFNMAAITNPIASGAIFYEYYVAAGVTPELDNCYMQVSRIGDRLV